MSHVNLNEIDLNQLKIAKSGKMIKLVYNKEPLQLITSKIYSPFGVKVNTNTYSNFTTCHLDCSLNQSNSETSVKYSKALEALDNRIIELIQEYEQLFNTDNDNINFNDIKSIYCPILKENKTYPKLMKISLPRDTKGNFDFVVFDETKNKITVDDSTIEQVLCKGKIYKGIIECSKIWYYKGKFGTTWNFKQLKFVENNVQPHSKQEIYQKNMLIDE